jgi:Protein of unknown function DUF262/Protein of unknown function (DUF1524)
MDAHPRSLDRLFNAQLRYVVPMFQRLYVWKQNPQWTTLWEDTAEKAELRLRGVQTNAHYLGALITEGVRSVKGEVGRFLVIDGQQRLTTLQLLFCAFRDVARKNDWKRFDRAATRYLENADADVMDNPDEERFKLWPTKLNRDTFRNIILAGSRDKVEEQYPIVWVRRRRKPEARSPLVDAYVYFSGLIQAWISDAAIRNHKTEEDCAGLLFQALQHDFCVVEIALSEGDDSQEIFYSLNSQGTPLSQSDLLRSLIFMRAEKEKLDRDQIFDSYWGNFETEFWSTEVKRGGRSYSRLDLGLRFFLMAKTGELVDARRVNEEYRRWIEATPPRYSSVKAELADFSMHAELYRTYESADPTTLPSTDLRRILSALDVSTAIPLILFLGLDAGLSEAHVQSCISVLESFLVRRAVTGDETKEYNKFFVEVVGSLRGVASDEIPAKLQEKLVGGGGTTRRWPTDDELIDSVIGRGLYGALGVPALRLVLERLEIALRTKKSEGLDIAPGLQIEHVLPERWGQNWKLWGKSIPPEVVSLPYLAKDELVELGDAIRARNAILHTLGNLTLLNKYSNPAAGNGAFDLKLVEYKNSVLRLNRYFDSCREWDEDAIRKRGRSLGELLCRVWPRPAAAT